MPKAITPLGLSRRLKQARIKKGMSLRDLEAVNSISNPYLSQVEQGKAGDVNPKKLKSIALALGLDYIELMVLAGYLTVGDLKRSRL